MDGGGVEELAGGEVESVPDGVDEAGLVVIAVYV